MSRDRKESEALFARARRRIPGGVNSPVRAYRAVGGIPPFIKKGAGSKVWDEDDHAYVDLVASWGPLILGHAHPRVEKAVEAAVRNGTTFGAPTRAECELAERVASMVPSIEMVRLVSSGTEATMSAVRLARAMTGRPRIIKFDGCYHGHADGFLIQAGSGATTMGHPNSPGVPEAVAGLTLRARFNDLDSVEEALAGDPASVAAVIVEPVPGNMGVVVPREGFLQGLRAICDRHGIVLIFDEVITGFRLAPGGAQEVFGVKPDLTTLGKILGGGFPLGAFGGRAGIMEALAPEGPVYQAGTLSGNPVAVAAGLATLEALDEDHGIYARLDALTARLVERMADATEGISAPITVNRLGSMFTQFFTAGPVTDYESATGADTRAFARYFHGMLENGIYLPPSQFEASFVSAAHTEDDIAAIVMAHQASAVGAG